MKTTISCIIIMFSIFMSCFAQGDLAEQSVNIEQIKKDRYTKFIMHIVWPSENDIRMKRVENELVKADIDAFSKLVQRTLSAKLLPSETQFKETIACAELWDGNDYILLRYSPKEAIDISIQDGKNVLSVLIAFKNSQIKSLKEIDLFVRKTAIDFLNFPMTNGIAAEEVSVGISSLDIGASKCGSLSYGPGSSPPEHWFGDIRWWSDGRRVLFYISKKEWTKEELSQSHFAPDLKPRRFYFRREQKAIEAKPQTTTP